MAAIEPVSLTIGVVALATLFSTCIECFDYLKAGQDMEEDLEILLVKLDLEKTRLLIWGNAIGVLKAVDDDERSPLLREGPRRESAKKCLERIKALFLNADKLQNAYGLRASTDAEAKTARSSNIVSVNSMSIFKTSYRRFLVRLTNTQANPGLLMKTKWAIHDKSKFEGLIVHLKDFIDGLNEVLPTKREMQDQIMHDDIASILDLSKLRLVQSACEGSYRALSAFASATIEASEMGTIDRRNFEEQMADASGLGLGVTETNLQPATRVNAAALGQAKLFDQISDLSYYGKIYFILTAPCTKEASASPCTTSGLVASQFRDQINHVFPQIDPRRSIGSLIADSLTPDQFTCVDLDSLISQSNESNIGISGSELRSLVLPLATIYIYCAPCACLIATAVGICETASLRSTTFYRFVVRPDDRLISSCCLEADRGVILNCLVEEIDKDVRSFNPNQLSHIDKCWIERRLFEMEASDQLQPAGSVADLAKGIFKSHVSTTKCAGIVILGELDYCSPIMQRAPFVLEPRMPRETEIFEMFWTVIAAGTLGWIRRFLGKYTPRIPPTKATIPSKSTNESSLRSSGAQGLTPPSPPLILARHVSPPQSPASKRRKSSVGQSSIEEHLEEEASGRRARENMLMTGGNTMGS